MRLSLLGEARGRTLVGLVGEAPPVARSLTLHLRVKVMST
jgi:hypothetical protein